MQMLVEGWRSVVSALEVGAPIVEVIVAEQVWKNPEVQDLTNKYAGEIGFQIYLVSEKEAQRLATTDSGQGIIAVASIEKTPAASFFKMSSIVALDGVQDPGNVGTIIRTAAWFGIEGIWGGLGTADFF